MSFTWADFALGRSAAHAALGEVFRPEWSRLTLDEGSRVITDLIEMADREDWKDLYKATVELRRRIRSDDNTDPGYLTRYVDTLLAGDEAKP